MFPHYLINGLNKEQIEHADTDRQRMRTDSGNTTVRTYLNAWLLNTSNTHRGYYKGYLPLFVEDKRV